MPYKILITVLFLVSLMARGEAADANNSTRDLQQGTQAEPQPEVPKQLSTVTVNNNRLSVEFDNVSFGEAIRKIGEKAGFKVEGSSKVFNKKLTVKFHNMDMDRGITRLFSLVKESNYIINYNATGSISRLRITTVREVAGSTVGNPVTEKQGDSLRRLQRRRILRPINPQISKDPSE